MTARESILGAIREALPGDPLDPRASHAAIARPFARTGTLSAHACLDLFIDRLLDYDTEIFQVTDESEIAVAITEALHRAGENNVVAPANFPARWLPSGVEVALDGELSTAALDQAQTVLTTCEVAVASTGTIVLVHGGTQGRRILTLLPDHHICLVRRDQVVELIPEAFRHIASHGARPITTISGPSATSDIEMTRVRGVHGPRRLTVILYGTSGPSK